MQNGKFHNSIQMKSRPAISLLFFFFFSSLISLFLYNILLYQNNSLANLSSSNALLDFVICIYYNRFAGNLASGGAAGASSLAFVYSLDYARTRLANDNKAAKKGGERQFNGLIDVYRKTLKTDGIAGLYRGFNISCVGIIVYRGLYFGLYDSLKPVLLTGALRDNFAASFLLGWGKDIILLYCI